MNENENDYVSLVRIPRKWFNIFVWTFSTLIIANTLAELLIGWAWKELGETILTRMAVLMTLLVGWFFILSHIWESMMLGYAKLFKERIRAAAREEVYKELEQAEKEGQTLGEVLESHKMGNDNGVSKSDTSKNARTPSAS